MTFRFESKNKNFDCDLIKTKCTAVDAEGNQCNKDTFIEPFCPAHLAEIHGVAAFQSRIPGAGLGMVALRNISRNKNINILPPYTGIEHTPASLRELYGGASSPYGFQTSTTRIIDAACQRSWASLINHGTLKKANAMFSLSSRKQMPVNIRASKNIEAGEEILLHYGNQYFGKKDGVKTSTKYPPEFYEEMMKVGGDAIAAEYDNTHPIPEKGKEKKTKSSKTRSKSPQPRARRRNSTGGIEPIQNKVKSPQRRNSASDSGESIQVGPVRARTPEPKTK